MKQQKITNNKVHYLVSRHARPIGIPILLILLLSTLIACVDRSTPPVGHSIVGSLDGRGGYLMVYWPEGLRIMIWDDLASGAHSNGSSSSTGDPVFHMDGGAQGLDGRSYNYTIDSSDGIEATFTIDEVEYDLDQGNTFLIRTDGGHTRVEQLEIDLSTIATTNAGIDQFGRQTPQIIAYNNSLDPPVPYSDNEAATLTPASTSPPPTRVTIADITALDRLATVILSNDRDARRDFIQFSTAGCVLMTTVTGPPKCTDGLVEGTPLDYFPVRIHPGESQPVSPDNLDPALDFDVTALYAAYRQEPAPETKSKPVGSEYGLIFDAGEEQGWRVFILLHTNGEGQILQLDYLACPIDDQGKTPHDDYVKCSPESLMEKDALEVLVQPPPDGLSPADVAKSIEPTATFPPAMTLSPTINSPPPTRVTTTGITVLDRVVAVILSNDRDVRREFVQVSAVPCAESQGLGGPPLCGPNRPEGTIVEYLPVQGIPGSSRPVLPDEIDQELAFKVGGLYAAYRQSAKFGPDGHWEGGDYGVIFEAGEEDARYQYTLFHINNDGQIVRLHYLACPVDAEGNVVQADFLSCTPASIIERDATELLVQPPPEGDSSEAINDSGEAVPPPVTPTPGPAVTNAAFNFTRPLYFLTSEQLTSSAISGPHGLWVLKPGSPAVGRVTPADQHVTAVDIHPVDGRIAYGTSQGEIFVITLDGQAQLRHSAANEQEEKAYIGSLSWSPNGEWLAFTASYQDNDMDSAAGGLWLLGLADETVIHLIGNRHIEAGDTDVSAYRAFIDVEYSPDGSALLLQASFWEYADTLWMHPIGLDPAENNLHDPEEFWRDGAWTRDGQAVLLSGWTYGTTSDLARVGHESDSITRLIDGQSVQLQIFMAQELPAGIAFLGTETNLDQGTHQTRLYLGHNTPDGFNYAVSGPDRDLCGDGYVTDIAWDPTNNLAAISCIHGVELISLDGSVDVDLTTFLEPMLDNNSVRVIWGS